MLTRFVDWLKNPCKLGHVDPMFDRVNGVQVFRCPRCHRVRETRDIVGEPKLVKREEIPLPENVVRFRRHR